MTINTYTLHQVSSLLASVRPTLAAEVVDAAVSDAQPGASYYAVRCYDCTADQLPTDALSDLLQTAVSWQDDGDGCWTMSPILAVIPSDAAELVAQVLELARAKHHLPSQWQAIQWLATQCGFAPRSIAAWLACEYAPQRRSILALEYLLTTLRHQ
jgi:hypothetical protein